MARKDGQPETSMWPLVGAGVLVFGALLALMWFLAHDQFCIVFLKWGYYQLYPFAFLSHLVEWDTSSPALLVDAIIDSLPTIKDVTAIRLFNLQYKAGAYYAYPLAGVFLYFAWIDRNHFLTRCRNSYLAWDLVRKQALTNPCIIPVLRFEELWNRERKNRHPNLERPMLPSEFAKHHDLIRDGKLDVEKSERIFLAQSGKMLHKIDMNKMPDHWKALAVVFGTRIVHRGERGRKDGQSMLDTINSSCDVSKVKPSKKTKYDVVDCFDFTSVASRFNELFVPDKMAESIHSAYLSSLTTHTFLMRLLREARKDGKLPTSQFIWLKMIDRELFFALNSVTPVLIARGWIECTGAYAQFLSEDAAIDLGMRMKEMYVFNAISAFEKRLFERGLIFNRQYLSKEDQDVSSAKDERKKGFEQQFQDHQAGQQQRRQR